METKTITYKIISREKVRAIPYWGNYEIAKVIIETPDGTRYTGISTSRNCKNLDWWEKYNFKIAEQQALEELIPDLLGVED